MPKVLNSHHHHHPADAVYIGRPGPWGNRYQIGRDGDRVAVVARHRADLLASATHMEWVRRELKGKDLVCFCAPAACHGDVLLEVANCSDRKFKSLLKKARAT